MKPLILIAFLVASISSFAQDDATTVNWLTNLENAKKISSQQQKPILMYFTGSDWCTPCVALKKDFFDTPEFLEKSRGYVLVLVDYPRRIDIISEKQMAYNKELIKKYNTDKSFPNMVVLNSSGRTLDNISGYSSYNTYHDTSHHLAFMDKHAPRSN